MADTMKPFEDIKEEIIKKVPDGYVLDDEKLGDLKTAYETAGGDLSKIDITSFTKKVDAQNNPKSNQPAQNGSQGQPTPDSTVINELDTPQDAPADENWKEGVLKEWQEWSDKKNKTLAPYEDKEHPENLTFRIYANEEEQAKGNFEADLSYAGPRNVTLKGKDGNIPSEEYFDKLVAQLKATNGQKIEFGNIQSDEFKAKLLAACLKDPEIQVINPPSQEQIATWDKNLQDMIAQAKPKDNTQESPSPQYDAAKNVITETLKNSKEIDIGALEPEKQALYTAAVMDLAGDKIKSGEITLKGAPKYHDLLKAAEKLPAKEQEAAKKGLTSYTITSMRNMRQAHLTAATKSDGSVDHSVLDAQKDGLTAEQIKLRELRGQARSGDDKAKTELDKRREQKMTDDYKYVREPEMEADGKTPKKDENGKPVYKKDENGNFVYKTDDKGNKVESAAYQAFKARLNGGNSK